VLERVAQHEARLGHRAVKGVDDEQAPVGHLEHALHLAAKVGVARRVDDVDLDVAVAHRDVLSEDCDATLALLVVGVEHLIDDLLIVAEDVRGLQEAVHDGGLAVVDVGNDRNVADVLGAHKDFSSRGDAAVQGTTPRRWLSYLTFTSRPPKIAVDRTWMIGPVAPG